MKRIIMTILTFFLVLSGCLNSLGCSPKTEKPVMELWASGSDNVRLIFEKLIEEFNQDNDYNQLGTVKLRYQLPWLRTQAARERMLMSYISGQRSAGIDLLEFSEWELSVYIQEAGENMFHEIDLAKVPNISNLSIPLPANNRFVIPYRGTTVIMAYNSDHVPNPPATTEELAEWIKVNPGRFAYNTPQTGGAGASFVLTKLYNPLPEEAIVSLDEKWIEQWGEGWEYLKDIHPYLYKNRGRVFYPHRNQGSLDLLASEDIWMTPAWADQIIMGVKRGTLPASIKIYQLDYSYTGSIQFMGIPVFGGNAEIAHSFINFLLSEKAQNILLADMAAVPLIHLDLLDPNEADYVKDLDINAFRSVRIGALQAEMYKTWDNIIGSIRE